MSLPFGGPIDNIEDPMRYRDHGQCEVLRQLRGCAELIGRLPAPRAGLAALALGAAGEAFGRAGGGGHSGSGSSSGGGGLHFGGGSGGSAVSGFIAFLIIAIILWTLYKRFGVGGGTRAADHCRNCALLHTICGRRAGMRRRSSSPAVQQRTDGRGRDGENMFMVIFHLS